MSVQYKRSLPKGFNLLLSLLDFSFLVFNAFFQNSIFVIDPPDGLFNSLNAILLKDFLSSSFNLFKYHESEIETLKKGIIAIIAHTSLQLMVCMVLDSSIMDNLRS